MWEYEIIQFQGFPRAEHHLESSSIKVINVLIFYILQVYLCSTDLGCNLRLLNFPPLSKVHLYFDHCSMRYLDPPRDILQGELVYPLNILLSCRKISLNFF